MPSAPITDRLLAWLSALRPAPQAVNARERLRVVMGAGLGLWLAGALSPWAMAPGLPWLVAPLGASAVLVFGVPAGPLAQPWAVVGGNTLSALAAATHSTKPEVVGQIMSRQVRVASAERPIAELVPLFSDTGHHHIPVVGEQARLVGILTQSDLVKALGNHGS